MKKLLLATVATIALTTAGAMAAEQSAKDHPGVKAGAEVKGHAGGSAQTTGSGAAMKSDTNAGAETKSGHGAKAGAHAQGGTSTRSKSETTGSGANAEHKAAPPSHAGASTKSKSETTGAAPSNGGSVNLTSKQRTEIRTKVIRSGRAPKIERNKIDFSLNIGTAVPRSIHVVAVPPMLVEIHPAWRGFLYFVVGDELVIVNPRTHQIVAIVAV